MAYASEIFQHWSGEAADQLFASIAHPRERVVQLTSTYHANSPEIRTLVIQFLHGPISAEPAPLWRPTLTAGVAILHRYDESACLSAVSQLGASRVDSLLDALRNVPLYPTPAGRGRDGTHFSLRVSEWPLGAQTTTHFSNVFCGPDLRRLAECLDETFQELRSD